MIAVLTVIAIWVGAVAAVATPIVYGSGNRWWTNYWGRTLMFKDVVIGLVYMRSAFGLLATHGRVHEVNATTFVLTAIMAIALLANLAVMIRVTFRRRSGPRPAVVDVDGAPEKDPVA